MALPACRGPFVGAWTGTCEVFADPGFWTVDVDLDIQRQGAGRVVGEGALVLGQALRPDLADATFEGPVTGEVLGDAADLRLEGVSGGYLVVLDAEARRHGDTLTGSCTVDFIGDVEGDFEAER